MNNIDIPTTWSKKRRRIAILAVLESHPELNDYTLYELAELFGVHFTTVSNYRKQVYGAKPSTEVASDA